jgi:hypothetical protein
MTTVRATTTLVLSVAAIGACAMPVIRGDFLKVAKVKRESRIARAQCTLCHQPSGTKLNPFGADVKRALAAGKARSVTPAVLLKLAKLDSDKDKVTNEKEWKADTLPGDPKSKPAK